MYCGFIEIINRKLIVNQGYFLQDEVVKDKKYKVLFSGLDKIEM